MQSSPCSKCNTQEVEDEQQFLLICPKYNNERLQLMETISNINPHFSSLTPAEKLVWILNNENKRFLCLLAKIIFENS